MADLQFVEVDETHVLVSAEEGPNRLWADVSKVAIRLQERVTLLEDVAGMFAGTEGLTMTKSIDMKRDRVEGKVPTEMIKPPFCSKS